MFPLICDFVDDSDFVVTRHHMYSTTIHICFVKSPTKIKEM